MATRFKFRYVNEIVGVFVLLAIGAVILAIFMAARTQRWFEASYPLTITLPREGSLGLKSGAEVMVLGTVVGSVSSVDVADDGSMKALASIRMDFVRFIRADSQASIKRTLAVAGDAYIDISVGKGAKLPDTGGQIRATADRGPTEMVDEVFAQVRNEVVPLVKQLRLATEEIKGLTQDLRDPDKNVQKTLAHVQNIAASIDSGQGMAGKLISDPELAKSTEASIRRVTESMADLQAILKDARKTTEVMPEIAASVRDQMKQLPALVEQTQATIKEVQGLLVQIRKTAEPLPDMVKALKATADALPGLVLQTQESVRQMTRLIEGVQQSWLVRPYMDKEDQDTGRIRPDQVGGRSGQ